MDDYRRQTASLRSGFAATARARKVHVRQIKADTAAMLQGFGQARAAQQESLQCELSFNQASRSEQVVSIRDAACQISIDNRAERVRMSGGLRLSLAASNAAVVNIVKALRVDFAEERSVFSRTQRQALWTQRQDRTEHRTVAAQAVVALMAHFRQSHRRMAMNQKMDLTDSRRERSLQMAELRRSFSAMRELMTKIVPSAVVEIEKDSSPVWHSSAPTTVARAPVEPLPSFKPSDDNRARTAAESTVPAAEPTSSAIEPRSVSESQTWRQSRPWPSP